jgi:undecaprenyl pyrophosphate phosphatase UppP
LYLVPTLSLKVIANILGNLKKKNKIEKVVISWPSIFHVYKLFWNRLFQMWSMRPEARTESSAAAAFDLAHYWD